MSRLKRTRKKPKQVKPKQQTDQAEPNGSKKSAGSTPGKKKR